MSNRKELTIFFIFAFTTFELVIKETDGHKELKRKIKKLLSEKGIEIDSDITISLESNRITNYNFNELIKDQCTLTIDEVDTDKLLSLNETLREENETLREENEELDVLIFTLIRKKNFLSKSITNFIDSRYCSILDDEEVKKLSNALLEVDFIHSKDEDEDEE